MNHRFHLGYWVMTRNSWVLSVRRQADKLDGAKGGAGEGGAQRDGLRVKPQFQGGDVEQHMLWLAREGAASMGGARGRSMPQSTPTGVLGHDPQIPAGVLGHILTPELGYSEHGPTGAVG